MSDISLGARVAACVPIALFASCASATHEAPARPEAVRLVFSAEIEAPVAKVWDTMLAPETYSQWTAPFMQGSYYEGSWREGERIHFLAPGGSGMVARVADVRVHERIELEHLGYVANGVEDTTSEAVRSWAPAYEIYRFESVPGGTRLIVEQDVLPGFENMMNAVWPKALAELEALCEGG